MVFDTETTSLNKPFCYDIGYCICDKNNFNIIHTAHYVIEQIWHNQPLFSTAYYAEKRPLYVQAMRAHKIIMTKFGYAMRAMMQDIKKYNVTSAYAYNSPFDDKVLTYNCDWYHVTNPLENIPIFDIKGYANNFITVLTNYKKFCIRNQLLTENGNYSATAENVYRFITNNTEFNEKHMGLDDSIIEHAILVQCIVDYGAKIDTVYKPQQIIAYDQPKPFAIKINGNTIYSGEYIKKSVNYDEYNFVVV